MILEKLITLRDILESRLPHIDRWERVGLYFHDDSFPTDTVSDTDKSVNHFYILWFRPRRKGLPNPYEYKEVPLNREDIEAVIKRQREKLRTESENL